MLHCEQRIPNSSTVKIILYTGVSILNVALQNGVFWQVLSPRKTYHYYRIKFIVAMATASHGQDVLDKFDITG